MSLNLFDILTFKIRKLFANEVVARSFDEFIKFVKHEKCTAVYGKVEVKRKTFRIYSQKSDVNFYFAKLFFQSNKGQIIAYKKLINQERLIIENNTRKSISLSDLPKLMAFHETNSCMKKLEKSFSKKMKTVFLGPLGEPYEKKQLEYLKAQLRKYGFEID